MADIPILPYTELRVDKPTAFYQIASYIKDNGMILIMFLTARFSLPGDEGQVATGDTRYKALIVRMSRTMPVETFGKLIELIKSGAKVVFVNRLPTEIPGVSR
jgi:hypothetical protein